MDSSQGLHRLVGVGEHQTVDHAALLEIGLAVPIVVDDIVAVTVGNAGSVGLQGSPAGLDLDLLSGLLCPHSGGILAHDGLNLEGADGDVGGGDGGAISMGVGLCQLVDGDHPVLADSAGELDAVLLVSGVVGLLQIVMELGAGSDLLGGDLITGLLVLLHGVTFLRTDLRNDLPITTD